MHHIIYDNNMDMKNSLFNEVREIKIESHSHMKK